MKRTEWENLISDNNGRHVGTSTILGYPIYAISDDKGFHKNKSTLPVYVCEITEEDSSMVNANGVSKVVYPMYICIPSKIMYASEGIDKLDIQMFGMIAIDSHMRSITGALEDTMRLMELWVKPHHVDTSIELMLHKYCMKLNEK